MTDDEDAYEDCRLNALELCGNPGQEAIINQVFDGGFELDFIDWMEVEGAFPDADEFIDTIKTYMGDDAEQKYDATDIIWNQVWIDTGNQASYHDGFDEYGEGTGDQPDGSEQGDLGDE